MDVTNSENCQNSGKKHDNSSQQSLVPGELPCSPQDSNSQCRGLLTVTSSCLEEDNEKGSLLVDTHPPSSYGHSISSNRTKTDRLINTATGEQLEVLTKAAPVFI